MFPCFYTESFWSKYQIFYKKFNSNTYTSIHARTIDTHADREAHWPRGRNHAHRDKLKESTEKLEHIIKQKGKGKHRIEDIEWKIRDNGKWSWTGKKSASGYCVDSLNTANWMENPGIESENPKEVQKGPSISKIQLEYNYRS